MSGMPQERRVVNPGESYMESVDSHQEREHPRLILLRSSILPSKVYQLDSFQFAILPSPRQPHKWIQMVIPIFGSVSVGGGVALNPINPQTNSLCKRSFFQALL